MLSLELSSLLNWVSKLLHTLDKEMMLTHFHLQGQPWKFHNTISSLYWEQLHSTMSSLTTKLAHHLKNVRQQQKTLPQYITHNVIIHLHWCSRCQGNILSISPTLLIALPLDLAGIKMRLCI